MPAMPPKIIAVVGATGTQVSFLMHKLRKRSQKKRNRNNSLLK
jgi:hypothetical protein